MKKLVIVIVVFLVGANLPAQTLFTWTGGGANENWTTSANWSKSGTTTAATYPNSSATSGTTVHNILIPASTTGNKWPILNGSYSCNNIEFTNSSGAAGTRFTFSSGAARVLSVYGNWTNNITAANGGMDIVSTANDGYVRFRGGSNTTFTGINKFREVAIFKSSNSNTVTMAANSEIEILRGFYPRQGEWIINANSGTKFTLLASSAQTAFIYGNNPSVQSLGDPAGTITGNVVVSTYIRQFTDLTGNDVGSYCTQRDAMDYYNFSDPNICNQANYRYFSSPIADNYWYRQLISGYGSCAYPSGPITGAPTSGPESVEIYPFVGLRWDVPTSSWKWGYSCLRFFNPYYIYSCHGQDPNPPYAPQWTPMWLRYDETEDDPRPETRLGPGAEYDCQEDLAGDDFYYGYKGFSDGASFSNRLQGLLCHGDVRGSNAGRTDRVITWEGTVNDGDIAGVFTHTDNKIGSGSTSETANGTNIAGNPYPSPISWQAMYDDATNTPLADFEPVLSIWQNNGSWTNAGSVLSYDPATQTGDIDGIIAIGQGFWLHPTNVGNTTLTLRNEYRRDIPNTAFYRKAISSSKNTFGIELGGGIGNTDRSFIVLGDEYSDEYEPKTEGTKVLVSNNSICSIVGDHRLVFNKMPLGLGQVKEIPLQVKTRIAGTYHIKAYQFGLDGNVFKAYLKDKETGKMVDFNETTDYIFTAKGKSEVGRFSIVLADANVNFSEGFALGFAPNYDQEQLTLFFRSNLKGEVAYTITDLSGRSIAAGTNHIEGVQLTFSQKLVPGMYLVHCTMNDAEKTEKLLVR